VIPAARKPARAGVRRAEPRDGTARAALFSSHSVPGARLDRWTDRHRHWLLAAAIALYAAIFGFHVWLKYRYYLYSDIDAALFVQAVDGLLHGTRFSSIRGMDWLGDHSSLILYALAPFHAACRHPATLPLLQTLALALGAVPVFHLARREIGPGLLPLAFAVAYLLYPAVGYVNLYEFHPEALSTPALLATFAAWRAGRLGTAAVFAALALMGKEDVVLPVGALAVAAALDRGRPRHLAFAATFAALALVSAILSFAVFKPLLGGGEVDYGRVYAQWGDSPGAVAAAMLRRPVDAIAAFFVTPGYDFDTTLKLQMYLHLLLPLAFLSLLAPRTLLLAVPTLATHMLSWRSPQHTIYYQYTAMITPFTVAAAVLAGAAIGRRLGRPHLLAGGLIAASVAANGMFGPLTGRGVAQYVVAEEAVRPSGKDRALTRHRDRFVAMLGDREPVVAGFEFLLRFAGRESHSLHNVVGGLKTFSTASYTPPRDVAALIADVSHTRLRPHADRGTAGRLERLVRENRLGLVGAAGDVLLFLRDAPDSVKLWRDGETVVPNPRRIVFDGELAYLGHELLATRATAGGILPLRTFWRRVAPTDSLFVIRFAAYDALGRAAFAHMRDLGYLFHPPGAWRDTTMMREDYRMLIPDDAPSGTYMLGMIVGRRDQLDQVLSEPDDPAVKAQNHVVELERFTVVPREH
jgi:uncharacterized membrane protein